MTKKVAIVGLFLESNRYADCINLSGPTALADVEADPLPHKSP